MGVLSRLMPQVQVFLIAIPLQILLSIVLMMLTLSAALFFWLAQYQTGMEFFLRSAGG
jgi:flagellar biosynthetic protein FliR